MARRPLLGLALAFAAGTAGGILGTPSALLLLPFLIALGFLLAWKRFREGPGSSLHPLSICGWLATTAGSAAFLAFLRTEPPAPNPSLQRPPPLANPPSPIITGTIRSSAVWVGSPGKKVWLFAFQSDDKAEWNAHTRMENRKTFEVLWIEPKTPYPPFPNERWQISGSIIPGPTPRLRTFGASCSPVPPQHERPLIRQLSELRRHAIQTLSQGIENFPRELGILRALVLGDRSTLPPDLRSVFQMTGVLHIIAISGLHVGMLAWLITLPLRATRLSRHYWFLILAPLLVLYTALTGAPPSATRACVMALLFFAAPMFGRRPDALSSLGAAAILILIWNPRQILEPGFLLSFATAGGLIAVSPLLPLSILPFWKPDPFHLPEETHRVRYALRILGRRFWELLVVSAAAWLIALPLTARFFGQISFLALPANLVAVPLAFLLIGLGAFSLVVDLLSPLLSEIVNLLGAGTGFLLVRTLDALAATPHGTFRVPKPSFVVIVLWYLLLVATLRFLYAGIKRNTTENPP